MVDCSMGKEVQAVRGEGGPLKEGHWRYHILDFGQFVFAYIDVFCQVSWDHI